jgi:CRISPR-associated protein (TIGR03986 family)
MSEVHAPYHFVPLSKWIYMPDWAHLVSHDVPFKDGYSGVLNYTLTNATPLCVGGEQEQCEGKPSLVKWVKDPMGNPVIPGSSLKGMIRSVLEISSFGKFSAIDDSHFSYRDVSSKSAYLSDVVQNHNVQAAWLKFDSLRQRWTLTSCDFAKIKHSDLKSALNKNIMNADNAVIKYKQFPLSQKITINTVVKEGKQGKVTWSKDINQGSVSAHIVFCNNRIKGTGKLEDYEFSYCFFNKKNEAQVSIDDLDNKANKLFASHNEEQVEYLLHNQSVENGIPVFALFEKKSNKLHSLGLAKMPRVLYNNAAKDLADQQQTKARTSPHYFDLSELMFGTLREKGFSLKSRVTFSDAILVNSNGLMTSKDVILNSPKATFKGAYLEQSKAGDYDDYNNGQAKISGWKRYITQNDFKENPNFDPKATYNAKVNTQIELLNKNSQFNGKIFFHNLKEEELGALLWTIQLGDDEQSKDQYHGLGHGKSLGAGAVQLRLITIDINANQGTNTLEKNKAITSFINHMNEKHSNDNSGWQQSPQIQNLLAMTNMQANQNRPLGYMALGDFKVVKNNKASLPPMEINGEKLKRIDSRRSTGALSFSKGRLASLCTEEDYADIWFNDQKRKQAVLIQEASYQQEQVVKAKKAAEIAEAIRNMSEDLKNVTELKYKLENSENINNKRECNVEIKQMLTSFVQNDFSKQAAQLLYDTVKDANICEYMNITNKLKLKARKLTLDELSDKYKL